MDKARKTRSTTPRMSQKIVCANTNSPRDALLQPCRSRGYLDVGRSPLSRNGRSPLSRNGCSPLSRSSDRRVSDMDACMDKPKAVSEELESLEKRVQSLTNDSTFVPLAQSLVLPLVVLVVFLFGTLCKCNLMLYYNAAELAALRHALTEHGIFVGDPQFTTTSNGSLLSQAGGGILSAVVLMVGWVVKSVVQCIIQLAFSIFLMPLLVYAVIRKGYYLDDFLILRNVGMTRMIPYMRQFPVAKVIKFLRNDQVPKMNRTDDVRRAPTVQIPSEDECPAYNLLSSPYGEQPSLIGLLEMYGENDRSPRRHTPVDDAKIAMAYDISDANHVES